MTVPVEITDRPDPADAAVVDAGLDLFNMAAADLGAVRPLAAFVRDAAGTVVGGAAARTWGRCCEIQRLWVDDDHRNRGIGRAIVERVEAEARDRGCTLVLLETFSFQAPAFYAALGYEVACEFAGFPDEIRKVVLRRDLS